jgi:Xaa-Pro aminopeptidase
MHTEEFKLRRQRLAQQMLPGSMAILWAASYKTRSGHGEYAYRQESNFYYLTKFEFAESVCVITKDQQQKTSCTLIIPDKDEDKEIWTGVRYSTLEVIKDYGVEHAVYSATQNEYIEKLISEHEHLYFDYNLAPEYHSQIFQWIKNAQRYAQRCYLHPKIYDLGFILKQLRYIKTPYEIGLMRKASMISAHAHRHLMQIYKIGMNERDLELAFRRYCLEYGLSEMSYFPIVAGGKNACTLHYNANNQHLHPGELVLIDAGAECEYYAADITRTWPLNGKFSTHQKVLYEIVLQAQLAGIAHAIPGNTWEDMHYAVANVLVAGLLDCKLLSGSHEENVMKETYKKYYMHSFGHWLGIDTHDQGIWRTRQEQQLVWQKLMPNMVLTMEPGIYISNKHHDIDPSWHNIGIRIEDNVLITSSGNEVLTNEAPKSISDLEHLNA